MKIPTTIKISKFLIDLLILFTYGISLLIYFIGGEANIATLFGNILAARASLLCLNSFLWIPFVTYKKRE